MSSSSLSIKKSKRSNGPSNCGSFIWYEGLFTSNLYKNKSRYEVRITGFKNNENISSGFFVYEVLINYLFNESLISRSSKISSEVGGGGAASSFFFNEFIALTMRKRTRAISIKSMTACKNRPIGKIVLPTVKLTSETATFPIIRLMIGIMMLVVRAV